MSLAKILNLSEGRSYDTTDKWDPNQKDFTLKQFIIGIVILIVVCGFMMWGMINLIQSA